MFPSIVQDISTSSRRILSYSARVNVATTTIALDLIDAVLCTRGMDVPHAYSTSSDTSAARFSVKLAEVNSSNLTSWFEATTRLAEVITTGGILMIIVVEVIVVVVVVEVVAVFEDVALFVKQTSQGSMRWQRGNCQPFGISRPT
jgi:hypothetical protein